VEVLLVGIPRVTRYTEALATASNETVERFYRDFGLDDGVPAYTVSPSAGKVQSQRYLLRIDGARELCFSAKLNGKLVSTLPITVSGLRRHTSAYLYDRKLKKARPLGVFEGDAWATVRVEGERDLFVGHPVTCDRPELFVQVTQSGEKRWSVEVHNPTDTDITAKLRVSPFFDPLAGASFDGREAHVAAGTTSAFSAVK